MAVQAVYAFSDEGKELIMNPMFLVYLTLMIVPQAWSVPLPKCESSRFERNAHMIHKTSIFGSDLRQNISQFARQRRQSQAAVKKEFAATGRLRCQPENPMFGQKTATIQITGRKNLATASAHSLFDPQCVRIPSQNCIVDFPMIGDGKEYKIKADSVELGACTKNPKYDKSDWAFFELEEEVDVTPYEIPPVDYQFPSPPNTPLPVLQVAAHADNLSGLNEANPLSGFNFLACELKSRSRYRNVGLQTDCSNGQGTSGSALLTTINGKHTIMAIVTSDMGEERNGQPYNGDNYFASSVSLEGDFLKALHRRMEAQTASQ